MKVSGAKQRRVLISGSTGLIGRSLVAARRAAGDEVMRLTRNVQGPDCISWTPEGDLDPAAVSGFDAVIHLAGEPVARARWTAGNKRRIRESRVQGTQNLAKALAGAPQPPEVFLCASGINFYGDCGDAIVDESRPAGHGFLAETCVAWEAAAAPLQGVSRVVHLRIGAVLSLEGGVLATMLPLFRWGLAGPIAGGSAFLSWVALEDVPRVVDWVLGSRGLQGALNVVSPEPVRQGAFTAMLAAALHRPAILPVPGWAARLAMGEMATETVLASIRAVPDRLLKDGFKFRDANLASALGRLL